MPSPAASNGWTTWTFRGVVTTLLGVLVFVYNSDNQRISELIAQNTVTIRQNSQAAVTNTLANVNTAASLSLAVAELRAINERQDQLFIVMTDRIADHETRIRALEMWRINNNNQQRPN
jgi:hypothetical protein